MKQLREYIVKSVILWFGALEFLSLEFVSGPSIALRTGFDIRISYFYRMKMSHFHSTKLIMR